MAKETKNEVTKFIERAIDKGLPVETMEKLFSLREKVKAETAREEFVTALGKFQSSCPVIAKTKKVMNKDGQSVRYQYAPLDAIISQIKKPLADSKLSYTWEVENKPDLIKATARITHALGHSEESSFEVPIDKAGYMTAPQKYASALTFAKRYALCNVLGISTGEEDTDATDVNNEPNTVSEKARIVFLLRSLGYKTDTKKKIEYAVKERAKLKLDAKNYKKIVGRLEEEVRKVQEDADTKV